MQVESLMYYCFYDCLVFIFRQEMASASQQLNRKDTKFDASGTNRSYDIKIEDFDISYGER